MSARRVRDPEVEWWMVELGVEHRDQYREVRALAWDLIVACRRRSLRSDKQNESS